MPIFVWGEGGCSANGTSSLPFLREIASYGFLRLGSTTASMMARSMDWAVSENSRSGSKYYGRLDTSDNNYQLRRLTRPIAYFIGGPSDMAYGDAMDDWGKLPAGLPPGQFVVDRGEEVPGRQARPVGRHQTGVEHGEAAVRVHHLGAGAYRLTGRRGGPGG